MVKKSSPLGSDWRSLTLAHLIQRIQGKNDSLTMFSPFHSTDCLEHPGAHPAEPWLLAPSRCSEEPPVKTETLLNILWFDLDEISHQILLLFMAKYPQATESNFYPFSFRHKFAVFKVETASDGRAKGGKKSPSPAVKTALLIFMKRYETRTKEMFCWLFHSSLVLSTAFPLTIQLLEVISCWISF